MLKRDKKAADDDITLILAEGEYLGTLEISRSRATAKAIGPAAHRR